jgi:transposase
MGHLSYFERGRIVGGRLAGTSVTKTATSFGVSRATVSQVMSTYRNHGKTNIRQEEQWPKINVDGKRSWYIEKDFSKNHRTTVAQVTGQQN